MVSNDCQKKLVKYLNVVIQYSVVMGCLLHLINLVAEKGAVSLLVNVEDFILNIYYYLEEVLKGRTVLLIQKNYMKTV